MHRRTSPPITIAHLYVQLGCIGNYSNITHSIFGLWWLIWLKYCQHTRSTRLTYSLDISSQASGNGCSSARMEGGAAVARHTLRYRSWGYMMVDTEVKDRQVLLSTTHGDEYLLSTFVTSCPGCQRFGMVMVDFSTNVVLSHAISMSYLRITSRSQHPSCRQNRGG